jgi:hypothetical protein
MRRTKLSVNFTGPGLLDKQCSYSTNEIAINWNAPMAFLAGAVQYEYLKDVKK